MKKTMKLILLGMFILSGYVNAEGRHPGVDPAESSKLIVNHNQSVIKLFYQSEKQGKVIVRIFDVNNALVHVDRIHNKNGFVRPYNFKELSEGEYRFEITDFDGKVEKVVEHSIKKAERNAMIRARLSSVDENENKMKLDVLGVTDEVVFVKILDNNREEIYSETIDIQNSFSRIYNLKKLRDREVSFEVLTENKLLLSQ